MRLGLVGSMIVMSLIWEVLSFNRGPVKDDLRHNYSNYVWGSQMAW
jgi:hypothetical protein